MRATWLRSREGRLQTSCGSPSLLSAVVPKAVPSSTLHRPALPETDIDLQRLDVSENAWARSAVCRKVFQQRPCAGEAPLGALQLYRRPVAAFLAGLGMLRLLSCHGFLSRFA